MSVNEEFEKHFKMMDMFDMKEKLNNLYGDIQELYEEFLQKGESFVPEIAEEVKSELARIIEERKEWEKEQDKGNQ